MTNLLRAQPSKGKMVRRGLNFFFWALLSVNILTSAYSIKQNAALTAPTDFGTVFGISISVIPFGWLLALLIASGCNFVTFSTGFLFFTNPKGIPLFLEGLINNITSKGGKVRNIAEGIVSVALFCGLLTACFKAYIYDLNTTAAGLGLPIIKNGLFAHPLNLPVFLIVFGPDVISVLMNAHDEMFAHITGTSTKAIPANRQQRYAQAPSTPMTSLNETFPDDQ